MRKKRILIFYHQNRKLYVPSFTINILKQEWEALGFEVKPVYGTQLGVSGDIAINHINLTVIPDSYLNYFNEFPIVLNRKLRDISKVSFSEQLLQPNDNYIGKVIIKTNANYGGRQELILAGRKDRVINEIVRRVNWTRVSSMKSDDYIVLDDISCVPKDVWRNKHLIVEKFLPEQDKNGNYYLRAWSFLGDKNLHVITTSEHPIIKGCRILKREFLSDSIPEELSSLRNQMGIDYGRFDYAVVDDRIVLYDINRTPSTSQKAAIIYSNKLKEMATGIYDCLS